MANNDTVRLYWPRESDFVDHQTNDRYEGEGVYEVPSEWEAHYRTRGWEDPPEDADEDDVGEPSSATDRHLEGPPRDELEGADPADVTDETEGDGDSEADDATDSDGDEGEDDGGDTGN